MVQRVQGAEGAERWAQLSTAAQMTRCPRTYWDYWLIGCTPCAAHEPSQGSIACIAHARAWAWCSSPPVLVQGQGQVGGQGAVAVGVVGAVRAALAGLWGLLVAGARGRWQVRVRGEEGKLELGPRGYRAMVQWQEACRGEDGAKAGPFVLRTWVVRRHVAKALQQ